MDGFILRASTPSTLRPNSNPIIFFLTLIGLITILRHLIIFYATYNFWGKDDPHL